MRLALIPQPKKIEPRRGGFVVPQAAWIGIENRDLYRAAREAALLFRKSMIEISTPGAMNALKISLDEALGPERYRLEISGKGIAIAAGTPAAAMHGVRTLCQISNQSSGGTLPCLSIEDWPDFRRRGVYYDVSRGRVPKLERLIELAENLAAYKINELQLYIEHTFAFRGHPKIGRGASPLTADDILLLDERCGDLGIELVPSLASFGHMSNVLRHKEYRQMAEDWGVGRYASGREGLPPWFKNKAWALSPANPETYVFLDSLFAELLPLFRSKRFNICCDETLDLGLGQSRDLCIKQGKGRVYLGHIEKLREISAKYGKSVMFWGDIMRLHPNLLKEIPKDATVLDWGYGYDHPFERLADLARERLTFYACPGTSSWMSLFPRLPEAVANIAGFAAAGVKWGADGLLVTDWGDGGHSNFMEHSWHGYLFGAEQGWNSNADKRSFTERFARTFLNTDDRSVADAITVLGDAAFTKGPYYQSIWYHLFFAAPGDAILNHGEPIDLKVSKNGAISVKKERFDAALGRKLAGDLREVRRAFFALSKVKGADPLGVLPFWIFAVDAMAHAATKLTVLGPSGSDTLSARRKLKGEMRSLMGRFEKLWSLRNKRSEIRLTLARYRKIIGAL